MRHIRITTFLVLLSFLLSSCDDKNSFGGNCFVATRGYYLNIPATELQLAANGDKTSARMNVTSYTTPWQFSGMDSWLSVMPASGNDSQTVTLSAQENTSGDDIRTTVFKFNSTDSEYPYEREMSVTQSSAQPKLIVSESDIVFTASKGSRTVQVDANIDYTVSVKGSVEWLTAASVGDGRSVSLTVDENLTGSVRAAEIQLTGKATRTLTVSQQAASVASSVTDTIKCPVTGASYELTVNSEVAWTAQSSPSSWIAVTPDSGTAGTTKVIVEVAANSSVSERSGFVQIFTDAFKALTIPVHQVGLYVKAGVTTVDFGSGASDRTIDIESNTSWSILSKPDWVSVSDSYGTGSAQITLSVQDNWSLTPLSGNVVIGSDGVSGLSCSIAVKQAARTFDDLIGNLTFGVERETQKVVIDTDGRWTATTADTWLHISPTSGTGKAEMEITADANPLEDERYGSVNVTVADVSKTIAVQQTGRFFTVSGGDASIPSTGGTHKVTISSNSDWTATVSEPSWMHLSQSSGNGNIEVTLTADDNPSAESRSNTTEFKATGSSHSYRIVTEQAGRYLTVDVQSLSFLSIGGERQISVSTDGKYDAKVTEGSWLTVRKDGNVVYVTAEKNESGEQRSGTIVVSLTDLKSGSMYREIAVQQSNKQIIIVPFGEDEQWD